MLHHAMHPSLEIITTQWDSKIFDREKYLPRSPLKCSGASWVAGTILASLWWPYIGPLLLTLTHQLISSSGHQCLWSENTRMKFLGWKIIYKTSSWILLFLHHYFPVLNWDHPVFYMSVYSVWQWQCNGYLIDKSYHHSSAQHNNEMIQFDPARLARTRTRILKTWSLLFYCCFVASAQ